MITLTLDIQLPEHCSDCPFSHDYMWCMAKQGKRFTADCIESRMEWCPLKTPVKPRLMRDWYVCECGASITMQVDGEPFRKSQYCCACGKPVDWS